MKISKEEKAMRLEAWKKSGKKAWPYAKEIGVIPQTFYRWIKGEAKKASGFVEIPSYKKPSTECPQEILIEKDGIKVHIPLSIWLEYPTAVMEGVKALL
jgi:hypothetical protein